jgi:hypothetical protein
VVGRSAPRFIAPILRPGGVLLLAVLVVAATGRCSPRSLRSPNSTFYDHVFLFVVPQTT